MKDIKINKNNIALFLILALSILPVVNIGGYELPLLYLLIPIGFFAFFLILLGYYKMPEISKIIILLCFLILLEIFLSTLNGTINFIGKFDFPTDILQYIARFIFLMFFIVPFYYGKITSKTFIRYFLVIANTGMLIGILQWIPWFGREYIVRLYPFYDLSYQLGQLTNTMSGIRVHGIAQHATANGGLATFFFIFGFAIFKYYKRHKFLTISLMVLSIGNIFASQARAGMLALVFSVLLLYLVSIYINKKSFKPTIYFLLITSVTYIIGLFLYKNGNPFIEKMIYRWEHLLFIEKGGPRLDQLKYFLTLLNTPSDYLFGISKQVVNQSAIPYGVEIEPANIFITYGFLGFALQYSLILILLIYFFKSIRIAVGNKAILSLLVAAFVGLASYQVFSIGFYFFREVRVGLFPWILMGVAIGAYEKYKKHLCSK